MSQAIFFLRKKAPAHHISVKGRGLLLLDFNQGWGDGTTISFYRVSVPYQIFNHPRGVWHGVFLLHSGAYRFVDIGVYALPLIFPPVHYSAYDSVCRLFP